ncbi:hypothetical protein DKX38_012608 [Salix brachista]|uniref:Uncharacterized protein n=1 Tax=Salix brachista TaxID=2182728 RepID=A0A5N5LRE2_9ROSI|nr:hypothetical protein DKX38_012608 [Salix brachista]
MLHSCGYRSVIYPLLDLEGALKQKSREGPKTPSGIFDSLKSYACILNKLRLLWKNLMNKGVGTIPLRSQAHNSLELFNCLASSSDHAYLDMHWGLIFIRSQWSFQLESQLMWMP